jgi:hypothetical protein
MHCCANKSCCAKSKGTSAPVSQPLHEGDDAKQPLAFGIVFAPVIDSIPLAVFPRPAREALAIRAHSPPPLAATCIRLI